MKQQRTYYVGLDIGTTKVVLMVGERSDYGKLRILGYGETPSTGVNSGVVQNIKKTTDSIMAAVQEAENKVGIKIGDVIVGIAGQHITSRSHGEYIRRDDANEIISIKDIERLKEQVRQIILSPEQEIIHILPQEFKVDNQSDILDPIGMPGSRLEAVFHLVIGNKQAINNIKRCTAQSNISVQKFMLEPLASANSVLSPEEKEMGVALVDIGGGTTDVAIFKEGVIKQTAVIPIGGNAVTDDVKEAFCILPRHAEQLKVNFGSTWPGENPENAIIKISGIKGAEAKKISQRALSEVIYHRMKEIIDNVFNIIKAYGYDEPRKQLNAGIVLTGGGSNLKHIVQIVEFITGLKVRIGLANEHLSSDSGIDVSSPVYATAVGLVMKAIEIEDEQKELQENGFESEVSKKTQVVDNQAITKPKENNSAPVLEQPTDNNGNISSENKEEKKSFLQRIGFKVKEGINELLDSSE